MTNYPAPPPSEGYGQNTPAEPPPAIKTSVNIVWASVALAVISTILTFVYLDDIVEAAEVSLNSPEADAARTGAIVASVIALLIFGALWILLGIFLRKGANWARIVLTVLAALGLLGGLYNSSQDLPAVLQVLNVIQMALYVALLVFMWKRESSDYIAAQRAG